MVLRHLDDRGRPVRRYGGCSALKISRIGLGAGVLVSSNRIPAVPATNFMTLNAMASRRIDFGIGKGFSTRRAMEPKGWQFAARHGAVWKTVMSGVPDGLAALEGVKQTYVDAGEPVGDFYASAWV
ncbi:MAG: LLM class flavin-dependent oxidoreductase [Acetobacteraceae bacterium]|nr:LLM class flavin-dependent oxidoreductase [Acetobacteraceae bacterium]